MAAAATAAGSPAEAAALTRAAAPQGRTWTSFAYDPPRHEAVLFGGDTGYESGPDKALGDTWTWTSTGGWVQQHPGAAPSARTGAAMAYDGAARQLLLFGGSSKPLAGGGFRGDTWVWTGTTWTRLHPAASPPARHNAGLVFDRASGELILFGGYDGKYLNDTWSWTGTTWTRLHPADSPSPRDTQALVYDPATKSAILFGGFSFTGLRLGDTWQWKNGNWTQLHPAARPGVVSPAWQAAFDGASQQLVVYGGETQEGFSGDTWAWTGSTWAQLHPAASPGLRSYGSMLYDRDLHKLVLFGGSTQDSDPSATWTWNGTGWRRVG